ncbi:hypothetical protein PUR59_00105, partial [Streptomyces sp. SP18ES09]|nr:hypothetical protein [Streptomyces sp. SP18ES09]
IAAQRRAGLPVIILSNEHNAVCGALARNLQYPVLHGIDRKDRALLGRCEGGAVTHDTQYTDIPLPL